MEQEAFKDSILVQLAGGNPPDIFSYWAGAKTQYLVDQKRLAPLDDVWKKYKLDDVFPKSLTEAASVYSGHKYLLALRLPLHRHVLQPEGHGEGGHQDHAKDVGRPARRRSEAEVDGGHAICARIQVPLASTVLV